MTHTRAHVDDIVNPVVIAEGTAKAGQSGNLVLLLGLDVFPKSTSTQTLLTYVVQLTSINNSAILLVSSIKKHLLIYNYLKNIDAAFQ